MGWKLGRRPDETVEEARPPKTSESPVVNGFYRAKERLVSGWILDRDDPRRKHHVEISVGGRRVGVAKGDRFDALVQSQHGGDGYFGFALYYDGDIRNGAVEASVIDAESKIALRSKQPVLTTSPRSGPPLSIEGISVGREVELIVRIGAYPVGNDLNLEFWSDGERVASAIAVTEVPKDEELFTAAIAGEDLRRLLAGKIEIALPGLKEAGLAIPLDEPPLKVLVSKQGDKLKLQLGGKAEVSGAATLTVRLKGSNSEFEEKQVTVDEKAVSLEPPEGFQCSEGSVEVQFDGIPVPTDFVWSSLHDRQFRLLGSPESKWNSSENAGVERGFFAFPQAFADERRLSGDIAHVSGGGDGNPLRLWQSIDDRPSEGSKISIGAFVRAPKNAKLAIRLRDDEGVLGECNATAKRPHAWSLLTLEETIARPVAGELVFEAEAKGRKVDGFDIAFTDSTAAAPADAGIAGDSASASLIPNGDFQHWPDGAGVRQHSVRGELCQGWRVFNRKTPEPLLSRAVTHPADGSLGLAVAAPVVKHYLRLEADLDEKPADQSLKLSFRAGIPAAARQLFARETNAVPPFAVIERVHLIRRLSITSDSGFEQRDSVAAIFDRKIPVGLEVEGFEYWIPPLEDPEPVELDEDAQVEETFHLAFDFRHPTVVALFDVELLSGEAGTNDDAAPRLALEDRNIELQVATLETVRHWRGPIPVQLATGDENEAPAQLKWSVGISREPVEIVVPVFNALPETLACLDSLGRSSTVPILVRLIDDGSDRQVYDALEHYSRDKPWIQLERFAQNKGYTFAADYGIRNARADWVVLLNSDTIVTRGWLEGMLQCARSDPAVAFVGPLSNAASYQSVPELYDASRKWKVNRLPPGITPDDMADIVRRLSTKGYPKVPLLNGFCTLMKRDTFVELGGLNPTAFPAGYGEENDLCLRALKAGVKLAVADDVYVYHVKSASFGNARRSELTKGGNSALKKLHPDVDIAELTNRFRETPELVALRKSVAAELSKVHGPAADQSGTSGEDDPGQSETVDTQSTTSGAKGLTCA